MFQVCRIIKMTCWHRRPCTHFTMTHIIITQETQTTVKNVWLGPFGTLYICRHVKGKCHQFYTQVFTRPGQLPPVISEGRRQLVWIWKKKRSQKFNYTVGQKKKIKALSAALILVLLKRSKEENYFNTKYPKSLIVRENIVTVSQEMRFYIKTSLYTTLWVLRKVR